MSKSKKLSKNEEKQGKSSCGAASGRDQKIEGDVISISNVGDGAVVAAGRRASASVQQTDVPLIDMSVWLTKMEEAIDTQVKLSPQDKTDLKEQVSKIADEVKKGTKADKDRLERLVNVLSVMAPDIFEVAIATLANPLAGLRLTFKKIGEKAKLMTQT